MLELFSCQPQQNLRACVNVCLISKTCLTISASYIVFSRTFFLGPKIAKRPSQYRDKFNRLIFSVSLMPMKLKDIARFESDNNLSITVFNFGEQGGLICCRRSRNRGKCPKIFLLLLLDGFNSHYCLITNFQAFMCKVCRSPKRAAKGPKTKFCVNCMQSIGERKFMEHARLCIDNQSLRIVRPSEHLKLTFSNWEKTQ